MMQMVNKSGTEEEAGSGGSFTESDEKAFKTFSVYCGLALHHAKLYDKIRKAESNERVGQELCAYYAQARQDEVELLLAEGKPRQEDHQDISTQM